MDTNSSTLFCGVAVGPKGRLLRRDDFPTELNAIQRYFKMFSLIFFWWFLDLPSHHTGEDLHLQTTKNVEGIPIEEREWMEELSEGYDDMNLAAHMVVYSEVLAARFIQLLNKCESLTPEMVVALPKSRFFADGSRESAKGRLDRSLRAGEIPPLHPRLNIDDGD
jgi:hypothetical protein